MKNVLKKGLLSAALLTAVVANASEKVNVKVARASKMLAIELTKVAQGETLAIKDLGGEILFSERLNKSNKFSKIFSLSTLPEGLYFVESKETSKVVVTPIIINKEGVALLENAAKTYLAPTISLEDDILNIKVRNYANAPVTIKIFDEQGLLLTKTKSNTNTLVFRSFEVKEIETKKLTVSVSEGDYNFLEEVKL